MPKVPRVRIAPSPTGMFHVGGARTALYNWLYVRRLGGKFILRIEDTDAERDREEWVGVIYDALSWLGLDWDEGPYRQSDNRPMHIEAGKRLYDGGLAYYCECTREQVEGRAKALDNKTPGYDRFCRNRNLGPGNGRALRFRVPEGRTVVKDLIRGDVVFDNEVIEDFVVVRSTGVPMYVLASAVDDIDQEITHVARGEEHLANTPKQMLLWDALGNGDRPTYAHLPLIVNEKRQKLSKRRDKVALESYRDDGILAEAMCNYLALLGWAPKGDSEVVPVSTLIDEFRFEDVNKSPAFFDVVKLTAINGEYIRNLEVDDFISRSMPFLEAAGGHKWPKESFDLVTFRAMAPLVQERVAKLAEIPDMIAFFFVDDVDYEEGAMKVMEKPESYSMLQSARAAYESIEWRHDVLHATTAILAEENGLKLGKAQAPIRLAVTGKKVGPPLFESLEVLGREEVMRRMDVLEKAVDEQQR